MSTSHCCLALTMSFFLITWTFLLLFFLAALCYFTPPVSAAHAHETNFSYITPLVMQHSVPLPCRPCPWVSPISPILALYSYAQGSLAVYTSWHTDLMFWLCLVHLSHHTYVLVHIRAPNTLIVCHASVVSQNPCWAYWVIPLCLLLQASMGGKLSSSGQVEASHQQQEGRAQRFWDHG